MTTQLWVQGKPFQRCVVQVVSNYVCFRPLCILPCIDKFSIIYMSLGCTSLPLDLRWPFGKGTTSKLKSLEIRIRNQCVSSCRRLAPLWFVEEHKLRADIPKRGCFVRKLCREIVTFRIRRASVTTFSKCGTCCFLNESLAMIFHPVPANRIAFPMCAAHHQIFKIVRSQQLMPLKSLDASWCKDDMIDMAILAMTSRHSVSLLGKSVSMGLSAASCSNSVRSSRRFYFYRRLRMHLLPAKVVQQMTAALQCHNSCTYSSLQVKWSLALSALSRYTVQDNVCRPVHLISETCNPLLTFLFMEDVKVSVCQNVKSFPVPLHFRTSKEGPETIKFKLCIAALARESPADLLDSKLRLVMTSGKWSTS